MNREHSQSKGKEELKLILNERYEFARNQLFGGVVRLTESSIPLWAHWIINEPQSYINVSGKTDEHFVKQQLIEIIRAKQEILQFESEHALGESPEGKRFHDVEGKRIKVSAALGVLEHTGIVNQELFLEEFHQIIQETLSELHSQLEKRIRKIPKQTPITRVIEVGERLLAIGSGSVRCEWEGVAVQGSREELRQVAHVIYDVQKKRLTDVIDVVMQNEQSWKKQHRTNQPFKISAQRS